MLEFTAATWKAPTTLKTCGSTPTARPRIGRNAGAFVPRAELDNQPTLPGYLGPMWDGDGLRYETQEIYNQLSD